MMSDHIRYLGSSYRSPSLYDAQAFKKTFGVNPNYLRGLALQRGWDCTPAQLRNKAEIRAGIRDSYHDPYTTPDNACEYMSQRIRQLGDAYIRPRVTDIGSFTETFDINPQTLSGRITERGWGITIYGLILTAEKEAGLSTIDRRSDSLDGYEATVKRIAEIIHEKGSEYSRPNLADREQFYSVFGVHYTTLRRRLIRGGWPVSSVAELINIAEEHVKEY